MLSCDLEHYEVLRELSHGVKSYLEIGVQEGGSLRAVLEESGSSMERLVLSDMWDYSHGGTGRGGPDHIRKLLSEFGYQGAVEILNGPSQVTIGKVKGQFELTHVDGGHTYLEALTDIMNVWPLTTRAMVVHDISFPEVWKAITEFTYGKAKATCSFGDWGTIVLERNE